MLVVENTAVLFDSLAHLAFRPCIGLVCNHFSNVEISGRSKSLLNQKISKRRMHTCAACVAFISRVHLQNVSEIIYSRQQKQSRIQQILSHSSTSFSLSSSIFAVFFCLSHIKDDSFLL